MKNIRILLALTVLLTGGAAAAWSLPVQAQVCGPLAAYTPGAPWVGPKTPWVYYNGDWFHNGMLHYYYGPRYGWAPHKAYAPVHIVRPAQWYGPKWHSWYQAHPHYWKHFHQKYPHWRSHRPGPQHYRGYSNMQYPGNGKWWKKHHGDW